MTKALQAVHTARAKALWGEEIWHINRTKKLPGGWGQRTESKEESKEEGKDQILLGLGVHHKGFGLYPKRKGQPMESLERSDMIRSAF